MNTGNDVMERVNLIADDDGLTNEDYIEPRRHKNNDSPYEQVVSLVTFGRFHAMLYLVCAMANASDAIEILCVSFVLPAAECDLHLTSSDKGLLSSMTFGGMLIGGYVWGTFSDIYGRKYMLISALAFNAFFGILCGLSQTFYFLLIFRFLSGIGVGGSVPIVWSYFSEFMPKDIRGRMICALASSWFIGNLLVILLAYILLDRAEFSFALFGTFIILNNWRIFMIVCSLPSLLTAILLLFLPESPKFHLYNGYSKKGKDTFKYIYKINNRERSEIGIEKLRKAFEIIDDLRVLPAQSDDEDEVSRRQQNVPNTRNFKYMLEFFKSTSSEAAKKTGELFKQPHTFKTLLVLFVFFCLCFGYYGLWMWLPELFTRMSITGGSPCNVGDYKPNSTVIPTCRIENSVFTSSFISALSNLPGNIITVIFIDKIGRNKITCFSLLASGITVMGIPFVKTETEGLILTTIFGGINVFTFNSFGCTSTELFPTRLRSTALGVQFVAARLGAILGNVVFGLAVDISCFIPLGSIAFLLIISGLLAFKIPESKKADIH